jgi:hypothetical protein
MLSEQKLCWLNSAIQLVISNTFLVESLSKHPLLTSTTHNIILNQNAFSFNAENDEFALSDFYSKTEEVTIKYVFNILKSSPAKPLEKHIVQKYIEDLREHGPKVYLFSKQEYLPIIKPLGQTSCVNDYLSNILLKSISNFIDIITIFQCSLTCSKCHVDNISVTETKSLLNLFTTDCEGSYFPEAALKNYFLVEKKNGYNTCNACGNTSEEHQYCKEIVQLPDSFFLSFIQNESQQNDNNHLKSQEFFIQNHLDMFMFASPQLVCYPSYFKYQLQSVIISAGDTDDDRHYYTYAKYGDQFYRCSDELIEPVDKSVIFKRKYSISCAMYVREKVNYMNFIDILYQILSDADKLTLNTSINNTHVKMMFDAALEYVARDTKALCWSYGAVYSCLQCKESE